MELEEYSEEELLEAGREAVKREQWPRAKTFLSAYVARFTSRGDTVPASGLASYSLCLGHSRELRRGLELCKKAQHADPRNPHIYWCLAQLHLLANAGSARFPTTTFYSACASVWACGRHRRSRFSTASMA
jgi:hypothetical protein